VEVEMCSNLIILIIAVVVSLFFLLFVYMKMKNGFGPYNIKVYGLTLVVTFTAILALSSIEFQILAPAYAILSAVAGYLFGLKNKELKSEKNNKSINREEI